MSRRARRLWPSWSRCPAARWSCCWGSWRRSTRTAALGSCSRRWPAAGASTHTPRWRRGGPGGRRGARAGGGWVPRRACEDLIRDGRVRVDGRVAVLGDRADPSRSAITVDDVPIAADPALRYYALNKPRGVTTTLDDPHARRTLAEFIPKGPRLFPVGRLDR